MFLVMVSSLLLVCTPASRAQTTNATIYIPSQCKTICVDPAKIQDVSTSADDFMSIDPDRTDSSFTSTRASTWGVSLLRMVSDTLATSACSTRRLVTLAADFFVYIRHFRHFCSCTCTTRALLIAAEWAGCTNPAPTPTRGLHLDWQNNSSHQLSCCLHTV